MDSRILLYFGLLVMATVYANASGKDEEGTTQSISDEDREGTAQSILDEDTEGT